MLETIKSNNCKRVDYATDGEQAINAVIQNSDYDIILMDLNMPIKDGYRAAVDILALTSMSKQPVIIAVSADAFEETIEACKQAGMLHHLKKPFTKKHLMRIMLEATR